MDFIPPPTDSPPQDELLPRRSMSVWRVLWIIGTLPFQIIFRLTRGLRWFILWPLRLLLSVLLVGGCVAGILIFLFGTVANRYDVGEVMHMPERTIVLDRKNREIGRLHGENRVMLELAEIPPLLQDAVILREDSRFYSHGGVDPIGVARAIQQVIRHKRFTQGASTITMQLAKTTFDHRERSLHNKFTEVAIARRIEATYTKKQILQAYLNRIFWGRTFQGIAAASRGYFNKKPAALTVGEIALLTGIICGPNEFSPIKHPERALKARNTVLDLLLEAQKITKEQYDSALQERVVITPPPDPGSEENYAMGLIRRELEIILEEENIRMGGLVVRTTLDLDLQNAVMDAINRHLSGIEALKGYRHPTRLQYRNRAAEGRTEADAPLYLQGAAVVLDNATGAPLCIVGGRGADESQLNRAIMSRRQVGSVFKPIAYAAFFDRGYNAQTSVSDDQITPGEIKGANKWSPRNADGRYLGMQTASFGLIKSRNTMAARVGNAVGLKNIENVARLAGFSGNPNPNATIYLGTWEASPMEVASAFTAFANGGVRAIPRTVVSISDANKNLIHSPRLITQRVFSESAARTTAQILQQVTKSGGTAAVVEKLGMKSPCGGKTGTTNAYTNAWFAGFTSNLTACVWVGFDIPKTIMDKGYGATLALPIWVDIMKSAQTQHYPFGSIRYTPATTPSNVFICRDSHCIAHSGCQSAGTAYYETMPGVAPPKNMCRTHVVKAEPVEDPAAGSASAGYTPPKAEPYAPQAEPYNDDDVPMETD